MQRSAAAGLSSTEVAVDIADSASTESEDTTASAASTAFAASESGSFVDSGGGGVDIAGSVPGAGQGSSGSSSSSGGGGGSSSSSSRCDSGLHHEPRGSSLNNVYRSRDGEQVEAPPKPLAFNTGGDSLTAFDVVEQPETAHTPMAAGDSGSADGSSSSSSCAVGAGASYACAPGAGGGGTPMPNRVGKQPHTSFSAPSWRNWSPGTPNSGGTPATANTRISTLSAQVTTAPALAPDSTQERAAPAPSPIVGSSNTGSAGGIASSGLRRGQPRPVRSSPLACAQRSFSAPSNPVLTEDGEAVRRASEPSYAAASSATAAAEAASPTPEKASGSEQMPVDANGNLAEALLVLARTKATIQEQIDVKNWQTGAMVSVRREGQPQIDLAVGEVRPGMPMSGKALLNWMSTTKVVAVVAIGQLLERKKIGSEKERVCKYVPEVSESAHKTSPANQSVPMNYSAAETFLPIFSLASTARSSLRLSTCYYTQRASPTRTSPCGQRCICGRRWGLCNTTAALL